MRPSLHALPFILLGSATFAQNAPRIKLVPWATGLDTITDITYSHPGDSTRLFVVMKQGMVKIVSDSMTVLAQPFLDISNQVLTAGHEQGLLGLAFDPNYADNGYFYVNYISGTGPGVTTISRFQVSNDADSADMASEQVIWSYPQPFENHNGGDLAFGPDGYLYIPLGDGGDAGDPQGHAQNLSDPLGDILRIDVNDMDTTYTIPDSNPWMNSMGDTLPEIWASGLRNPFRISFDRMGGDMWLGDVGQSSWEEVDYMEAGSDGGANFGWRCYEGPAEFNTIDCVDDSSYTQPVAAHINDGNFGEWCSVIGGYVYRGSMWPHLYGRYIYTDYCKSQFWSLRPEGDSSFVDEMLMQDTMMMAWTTFGENADGELFVGNEFPGDVYMIADRCPMEAPVIDFNGLTLSSTSSDSTYMWFLDNLMIPGATESTYVPMQNGNYFVQAIYTNGCILNSYTLAVIVTGVSDLVRPLLNIQPNPASDQVVLEWSNNDLVGEFRLLDMQGRRVRGERGPAASRIVVELDDLATGTYSVQLLSHDSVVLAVKQLAVVR